MHIPSSTDNIRLSGNRTPSQVANQDLASRVLLYHNQSDKTPDSELCASDSSNKCIRRPFFFSLSLPSAELCLGKKKGASLNVTWLINRLTFSYAQKGPLNFAPVLMFLGTNATCYFSVVSFHPGTRSAIGNSFICSMCGKLSQKRRGMLFYALQCSLDTVHFWLCWKFHLANGHLNDFNFGQTFTHWWPWQMLGEKWFHLVQHFHSNNIYC